MSIKREMFLTPCVLPALNASFFLAISFSTFSLFSFNCRQSKKGGGRGERKGEGGRGREREGEGGRRREREGEGGEREERGREREGEEGEREGEGGRAYIHACKSSASLTCNKGVRGEREGCREGGESTDVITHTY